MMASHDWYYEPIELRKLKAKLASITCDCLSCDRKNCLVPPDVRLNQQTQVGEPRLKTNSFDRFTQATSDTIIRDQTALLNTLTKDILCPSCFITMNLLRGGVLKVLKDQESETKHDIFTCDKCIGKTIRAVERSTSHTAPISGILSNNVSVYDDYSDDDTFSQSSICQPEKRQHSPHQVKFDVKTEDCKNTRGCVCLEDFIDSIRPPIRECIFPRRPRR